MKSLGSKISRGLLLAILLVFCSTVLPYTRSVFATASADMSPVYKVLLNDVYSCYSAGAFKNEVLISDLTRTVGGSSTINKILDKPNTKVTIPNGLIGTVTDKEITCESLLNGQNTWFHGDSSGIIKNPGAIPGRSGSSEDLGNFLTSFGYSPAESAERCFRYKYIYTYEAYGGVFGIGLPPKVGPEPRYTDYICAKTDDPNSDTIKSGTTVYVKKSSASTDIVQWEMKNGGAKIQLDCNTQWWGDGGCGAFTIADYSTWSSLQNAIFSELAGNNRTKTYTITMGDMFPITHIYTYTLDNTDTAIDTLDADKYHFPEGPAAASKALINGLSGSDTPPKIDTDDVARLYVTYLIKFFGAKQVCGLSDTQIAYYTATGSSGYGAIEYRKNAAGEQCYVYATQNKDKNVNGMTELSGSLGYAIAKDSDTFASIVEWLKGYSGSVDVDLDTAEVLDPENPPSNGGGGSAGDQNCYNSTSLGWILCPILDITTDAIGSIYTMIEDNLEINNDVIGSSGGTGTYQGWQVFQNFANIAVIVLLLIVIFSQITGIGIDNYGIKKTLPKLIVAAILINLSFIVCQAAVDLSNILGYNLKTMLGEFAGAFGAAPPSIGDFADKVGATIATGAGIGVAGVTLYFTWSLWLIPLLLSIVGMLISIIFFFIIISVRKALVIVFVVIAPLAIAGYMLPNTKKWFDKWFKIFGALLLVFPICGLLMGAGTYVSALLLNAVQGDGDFLYYLVAMLMQIAPFFFIPTILKGSMAGIGNIGAKISSAGKSIGGAAKKGIGSTELVKDAQRQMNLAADKQRSRRLAGLSKRLGNPQFMQRRLGAVNQRIASANAANSKDASWATEERMQANADALALKESEDAISDAMTSIKAQGKYSDGTAFDAEDGKQMYIQAKAARARGQHTLADAIIDLAGQNGKAASQFQEALRKDAGHHLSKESATRMVTGAGKSLFKATDGISYQYARETYNGSTTDDVTTWTGNVGNIERAIEKNINSAEAYASQSKDVLSVLNANKAAVAANSPLGATLVTELEYSAAEAAANSTDASKAAEYATMRVNPSLSGGIRQTRAVEAQEAQTAAQTAATDAAAMQQFESSHVTNAELKRAHAKKKGGFYEQPEGFSTNLGGGIYENPTTGRKYDAKKNKFFS